MMYSYEITKILQEQNYNIDSKTYLHICNTSPQLTHIKYHPYENFFEMWDDKNNYWKFTVHRKD